jgi:hypothetical protein
MGLDEPPALMGLALDIGFASLALGIERVEVLFETMLGGFPGIDGATRDFPLVILAATAALLCLGLRPAHAEEPRPVPLRPGDRTGNVRQAAMGLTVPEEAIIHPG